MGTLKQFDTTKNQIDELKLSTKSKDKVVIWVEGNDWKLYGRFFKSEMVDNQGRKGGHSCYSVKESYDEFKKQYPTRLAIVIMDADFMRLNGNDVDLHPDIFYADCHDHEMMCIYQENVREVLLNNFMINNQNSTFFDNIFSELLLLSYLKWYNSNNQCGYNFDRLGNLFCLPNDFFTNLSIIENEVYTRSLAALQKQNLSLEHIDMNDLTTFIDLHPSPDFFEITNGHDFYNRINYYIQQNNVKNKRSEDTLKDTIYAAFTFVFKNTQLYNNLNNWCIRNNTYILKVV